MLDILSHQFVWLAVLCSLILAGIHAYLGFHIVSRGVIFVDLALAQMAAVGAAFATLIHVEHGRWEHYAISLAFTLAGAWIVSISRVRDDRIPQEAFIGILYAVGAALTILLLARKAGGMEELHHLLQGSILTVTPKEITTIAVIYSLVGVFHLIFRSRFFLITEDRSAAAAKGWNVRAWDFVFYGLFAIVVTSSVAIAGVLLVFSLLVIPPVVALFLASGQVGRLVAGWTVAVLGALLGIVASIQFDYPAGPSIIAALAIILLVVAVADRLRSS